MNSAFGNQYALQLIMRFCWILEFYDCTISCGSCKVDNERSSSNFQIWNTNSGCLLVEWKPSDGDDDIRYSCTACSFTGKKVV